MVAGVSATRNCVFWCQPMLTSTLDLQPRHAVKLSRDPPFLFGVLCASLMLKWSGTPAFAQSSLYRFLSGTRQSKAWLLRLALGNIPFSLLRCCQSRAWLHHSWLKKCSTASPITYKVFEAAGDVHCRTLVIWLSRVALSKTLLNSNLVPALRRLWLLL